MKSSSLKALRQRLSTDSAFATQGNLEHPGAFNIFMARVEQVNMLTRLEIAVQLAEIKEHLINSSRELASIREELDAQEDQAREDAFNEPAA